MSSPTLAQLERVDLREAWLSEAQDFTPWLAQEASIALLGKTIGMELEVEAQEQRVGPFRADILCKDTLTDAWVLVENQLERTDHTHLGQLLTYAAGLSAVTIVWVAAEFTDEHRATLDWLNEITDDRFNFFGLQIELWRIGDSPSAPRFNVISRPNDWTRRVAGAAHAIREGNLTPTQQVCLDYWTSFRDFLSNSGSPLRSQKPLPQSWTLFALGRSNLYLMATISNRGQWVSASLVLSGPDAKGHFRALLQERQEIDLGLGGQAEWREMPEKKESHIVLRLPQTDPSDQEQWPVQHQWLRQSLERLRQVFGPRVRGLVPVDRLVEAPDPEGDATARESNY
ncbi:MAG TPA: DUF4268 domain-containing protein [Armatimonadota bacterium]|jgi:hypothetical protein